MPTTIVPGAVAVCLANQSITIDGTVTMSNFPTSLPVTDNGSSLTVDDGGSSLTIDGSVSVSNFPSVQAVSDNGGSLTVDGTVSVSAVSGNVLNKPYTPASADILSGTTTITTTTATTIITIPAGRVWVGSLALNYSGTGTGTTHALSGGQITVSGTNAVPASGTILLKVNGSTILAGGPSNSFIDNVRIVAPVGNSVTVQVAAISATTSSAIGSASGVLL